MHAEGLTYEEKALVFSCGGESLVGVATLPARAGPRGVLVVVGGPQYRAGSHRQFTLLARTLAKQGIPAMRFDYRGMGDSGGAPRSFEDIETDLRCALDQFMACVPGMREVVLWGLCDGASAAAMYAAGDPRVTGLVLLNPWVRTGDSLARATLKHYYRDRLLSRALWAKILRGRFRPGEAAGALFAHVKQVLKPSSITSSSLPERMHAGLARFSGPVLVVLSGSDLTAREFADLHRTSPEWRQLLGQARFTRHELAPADHTFSRCAWRDQVATWTADWMQAW